MTTIGKRYVIQKRLNPTNPAKPGFVELDINDELRQFAKGKDYAALIERSLAAVTNALLSQQDILRQNLQGFVDWTAAPGTELNPSSIFEKITELFGNKSKIHKVSEDILQITCGKRAECIETRRERILSELPNRNLREGLRKIPPSAEHLFDKASVKSYVQSTGGIDKWVKPWFNTDPKKSSQKSNPKPGSSKEVSVSNQSFRSDQQFKNSKRESSSNNFKLSNTSKFKKPFRKENQSTDKKKFK